MHCAGPTLRLPEAAVESLKREAGPFYNNNEKRRGILMKMEITH